MFIEALFTIAKTWEQLKCPSTDEWIKKMCVWGVCVCVCVCVYIHTYIRTHTHNRKLSHKREQKNAICSNMDEPKDYHTK